MTQRSLPPTSQPGYYLGFSTLGQQNYWDAATREVVRKRVEEVPPLRFFNDEESKFMGVVCDHLLPQDDRDLAHRIPVLPYIDERLFNGKTPGYRFASMPPDGEAYRLGMQAMEQMAQRNFQSKFLGLTWREQEDLLKSIHDAKPLSGAEEIWARMPFHRYFALVLQDCVEMYYAHPWAWDEIGFGGPAYPRAYMRLERGEPEPWEVEEQRYEWRPDRTFGFRIRRRKKSPRTGNIRLAGQGGTH